MLFLGYLLLISPFYFNFYTLTNRTILLHMVVTMASLKRGKWGVSELRQLAIHRNEFDSDPLRLQQAYFPNRTVTSVKNKLQELCQLDATSPQSPVYFGGMYDSLCLLNCNKISL